MGAVEHLKTLCCLGLKPESAMIAVTPLLHEIIPHGWSRMGLLAPDATITSIYAEHPALGELFRERLWFCDREMIGLWNFVLLTEISRARKRFDDLPSPKLRQDDELILDQLLSLDLKLPTFFQIDELFV
jgi:hypothetical protein